MQFVAKQCIMTNAQTFASNHPQYSGTAAKQSTDELGTGNLYNRTLNRKHDFSGFRPVIGKISGELLLA